MQQRIVVKVAIKKEKDRSKAMKIAVGAIGVSSVMIGGEDKDVVIVIGNEVDAVTLTRSLVKKFGKATLVRVEPFNINAARFNQVDQSQVAATMIHEGQPSNYSTYGNNSTYNNIQTPLSYYSVPPPYPPPQYYYANYDKTAVDDSSCSIM